MRPEPREGNRELEARKVRTRVLEVSKAAETLLKAPRSLKIHWREDKDREKGNRAWSIVLVIL